jgi:hypothetical protein
MLIQEFIKTHTYGLRKIVNFEADTKSSCSGRLRLAIKALKDFSILRSELLTGIKAEKFAANPKLYAQ